MNEEEETKKETDCKLPADIRIKFISQTTPATPMKSRAVTPLNAKIRDELKAKIKQKERSLKKPGPRKISVQDMMQQSLAPPLNTRQYLHVISNTEMRRNSMGARRTPDLRRFSENRNNFILTSPK